MHTEKHMTLHEISKTKGIELSSLKYYIVLYKKWGDKAFIKNDVRRKYSRETKLKAIQEHVTNGTSFRRIAIELMLTDPKIVSDWVFLFKEKGEEAIKDTYSREAYKLHDDKILEKEYKKLLEDLQRTKAENEYLKKIISPSSKKKQTIKEKALIVKELRGKYKFSMLLEIANLSKQAYYYEINHLNDKDLKDKLYEDLIIKIFNNNYQKYGVSRITDALNDELE